MATLYETIEAQLTSSFKTMPIITAGGICMVCVTGTAHKATLYNPDDNYSALANPLTPTRGKIRFAVSTTSGVPQTVDLYGMTPGGRFFVFKGATPGFPTEIMIDTNTRLQTAVIPWSVADSTAGTEKDTGIVMPVGSIIKPSFVVGITTAAGQGSKTIDFGTLSTQSGGDANGFIEAISLTSIASVVTKLASTGTLGALVRETTTGAAAVIPVPYVIGATAINLSYTILSGATLAEGLIQFDYEVPALVSNT